ncbi:hypothetical protein L7F22_003149 [Adiantum nelumboides]|nr:hypothetical protein [Adiantum nelumboides]
MTSTPPPTAAPQKAEKPSLSGVKIKQRKGVAKSQAKFEPEEFAEQLLKFLEPVQENDWEGLLQALDKAGNTLDYHLFYGGLLAPGGSYLDEDIPLSKFSVFAAKAADIENVKPIVSTLEKLIRRFKFLQKPLEEQNLSNLIQYASRYPVEERKKLAVATALLIQMNLVNANVLLTLQKEHLVKEGVSLADYFSRRATRETRDSVVQRIKEMRGADVEESEKASDEDVVDFLKEVHFVSIVWDGLLSIVKWDENEEKHDVQALKEVKSIAPILEPFCTNAKCEIALINTIQVNAHEDNRLTKSFPNILKVLYNDDVLSDQAILYWAQKGAKPQGKAHFLKVTEPLV